jgi:GPI mannosyltransferase 1 subunit M
MGVKEAFVVALLLRIWLIFVGELIDESNESPILLLSGLSYTDVDYKVFSYASDAIWSGASPYDREDYRYPPLLAWLMLPNRFWPAFGKLIFCFADSLMVPAIYSTLTSSLKFSKDIGRKWSWLWAFNFLAANICSRGNADAIVNLGLIILIKFILERKYNKAGLLFGILVYWRLYPMIYIPILIYHILYCKGTKQKQIMFVLLFLLNATFTCMALVGISWWMYGDKYISSAILYHFTRSDTQHNFSPHFYPAYLCESCAAAGSDAVSVCTMCPSHELLSLLPTIFQAFLLLVSAAIFGIKYPPSMLPAGIFTQTFIFVTFNKVSTAQYFTWYGCLLPLIMPMLYNKLDKLKVQMKNDNKTLYFLYYFPYLHIELYLIVLIIWLRAAFLLEFGSAGAEEFLSVWMASCLLHLVCLFILSQVLTLMKQS